MNSSVSFSLYACFNASYTVLNFFFLVLVQFSATADRPSALFNFEGFFTFFLVSTPPCYTGGTMDTGNGTDFAMLSTLLSALTYTIALLILRSQGI